MLFTNAGETLWVQRLCGCGEKDSPDVRSQRGWEQAWSPSCTAPRQPHAASRPWSVCCEARGEKK